MKQSTGHNLGYASFVLSATCAGVAFYQKDARPFFGAVVFGGIGTWLLNRLYLGDPEAVKAYKRQIMSSSLSVSLAKSYPLDSMLQIITTSDVAELLESECPMSEGMAALIRVFTLPTVEKLKDRNVLSVQDLRYRCDLDVAAAGNFTSLWQSLGGKQGLSGLTHIGALDSARLREKLLSEYSWIDTATCKPTVSSPTTVNALPPGSPMGVLKAVEAYGSYAVSTLGVSNGFWRAVIATSPDCEGTLSDLLKKGEATLFSLNAKGFIDHDWIGRKFDVECERRRLDLWGAETHLRLSRFLSERMIHPSGYVLHAFQQAIPVERGTRATKEANIIHFLEYWEATLRAFPELMPSDMQRFIAVALRQWRDAQAKRDAAVGDAQKKCADEVKYVKEWSSRKDAPLTDSQKKEIARLEGERDKVVNKAKTECEDAKLDIQTDFSNRYHGINTGGGSKLTVELKTCAQQ